MEFLTVNYGTKSVKCIFSFYLLKNRVEIERKINLITNVLSMIAWLYSNKEQ